MAKALLIVAACVMTWLFLDLLEHAATHGYPVIALAAGMAFAYALGRLHKGVERG